MTPDAIAYLLAIIGANLPRDSRISGNYPRNPGAREIVEKSGFRDFVRHSGGPAHSAEGAIVRQDRSTDSQKADGAFAKKLIDFAATGRKEGTPGHKQCYSHLIECMGNTHEHAGEPGQTRWWASVYRDQARNRDCFTFIDMGVGVFRSVELSLRLKLLNFAHFLTRSDILLELLKGNIPSSTRLIYRGRGLPSLYQSAKLGTLRRLVILTNNVYGDIPRDLFRGLKEEVRGVVLYWEVSV